MKEETKKKLHDYIVERPQDAYKKWNSHIIFWRRILSLIALITLVFGLLFLLKENLYGVAWIGLMGIAFTGSVGLSILEWLCGNDIERYEEEDKKFYEEVIGGVEK